jgi:hypothetical protein
MTFSVDSTSQPRYDTHITLGEGGAEFTCKVPAGIARPSRTDDGHSPAIEHVE